MDIQKLRLIIDSSAAAEGAAGWKKATGDVSASATAATASITKMESATATNARQLSMAKQAADNMRAGLTPLGDSLRVTSDELQKATAKYDAMFAAQKRVTDSSQAIGRAQIEAIAINEKMGQTFNTTGAGLGRLRMGFTSLASQLTGTNPILDRTVATLASMGIGTQAVLGMLGAVVAVSLVWRAYTEDARKAVDEQDKMTKSLEAWYAKEREGAAGDFPKQIQAETEKIQDLKKELASFGQLGAVGEGGSKGLAWVRLWTDAVGTIAAASQGQVNTMKGFWQKLKDEIHDGAAHATNEITTGFAAIHAASVQAHNLIQRQQADALASLIESHHATAAERAKARQVLAADIAELAKLDRAAQTGGGTKIDMAQRVALAEEIKKLTTALDPPKLTAAQDRLEGIADAIARMRDEAKQFGANAGINNRTQTIIDDLDRLEKKFPQLTAQIEQMKSEAVDAGDALKTMADDKVSKQINDAYAAQVQLNDAMHDHAGTFRELSAVKRADMEIDRLQLQLGHQLTNDEKDKIHFTYENAAALIEEGEAAKKSAEAQKQAAEKVIAAQKQQHTEMTRDLTRFFDDAFTKGLKSFTDLFDTIKSLFLQLLAQMAAKALMAKIGDAVLASFGMGSNGNSANPKMWQSGLGIAAGSGLLGYQVGHASGSYGGAALGGLASGALTGAMIGNAVPVIGTAVGAVIGAVAGLVGGLLGHAAKVREEAKALSDARKSFFTELDKFTYGLGDHSTLESSLHDLSTSLDDVRKKAADLKINNTELAAATAAAADAAARMKKEFLDSIDQQINQASGRDYINSALNFQKQYEQNLKDIALAGGDGSKAVELFIKQMEQLGSSLDPDQLKALIAALPELTKNLNPGLALQLAQILGVDLAKAIENVAKQAAAAAEVLLRASENLQVRFAHATGDSGADMMALKFQQRQEMMDAANSGATPEYLAQLKLVQLYETAQAIVQRQIADQIKIAQDQLNVQQTALSVAQNNLNATQNVVDSLAAYRQSLLTGSLSTLNPEQQIAEARKQLMDAFSKAMGGDKDAAGKFQELSKTFLELLQKDQASGPKYAAGFADVTAMLAKLADKYGTQLLADQKAAAAIQVQIDLLNAQLVKLNDVAYQTQLVKTEVVKQLQAQQTAASADAALAVAELKRLQEQNDAQLITAHDQAAHLKSLYDQAVKSGDADAGLLYSQWQTALQLEESAKGTHDKIVEQILAIQKADAAQKAASIDLIAAVNSGASFGVQAQLATNLAIAAQTAQDQRNHLDLIKYLMAMQQSLELLLKGVGTGPVDIRILGRKLQRTSASSDTSAVPAGGSGGGSNDAVDQLKAVVSLLSGIRADAQKTGDVLAGSMQSLQLEFAGIAQQNRFSDREL